MPIFDAFIVFMVLVVIPFWAISSIALLCRKWYLRRQRFKQLEKRLDEIQYEIIPAYMAAGDYAKAQEAVNEGWELLSRMERELL